MKSIYLLLFLFLASCAQEDSTATKTMAIEAGTCEERFTNQCETDGTKCYDECGNKIKLISCYKLQDGVYRVYPTLNYVPDVSYCDLILEKGSDYKYFIQDAFPPFVKEKCSMGLNQLPTCVYRN